MATCDSVSPIGFAPWVWDQEDSQPAGQGWLKFANTSNMKELANDGIPEDQFYLSS